ncbi:MAG: hypothetical protein AAF849_22355 [Bacteroidota bacterium]
MNKKHQDIQAIMDLVAVRTLVEIAWHSEEVESSESTAVPSSDIEEQEVLGNHQSDSSVREEKTIGFYFRLARLLRQFFRERNPLRL